MRKILLSFAALSLCSAAAPAALAGDRPPSDEERGRIESVLRDAGFVSWERIELEDDGMWEVDDAVDEAGREYDLELDTELDIIERDLD